MECSGCNVSLIQTSYCLICPQCGIETRVLQNVVPGYTQSHAVLQQTTSYSRRYRFRSLLLKTVCFHHGPPLSDSIWTYLESQRPFENTKAIQTALSKTTLKNKRYDMLPIFSRAFLDIPRFDVPGRTIRIAMRLFDSLESRWKESTLPRFFSYFFLLEAMLTRIQCTTPLKYCKTLICPRRRQFYTLMLEQLGGFVSRPQLSSAERQGLNAFRRRPEFAGSTAMNHPPGALPTTKSPLSVASSSTLCATVHDHVRRCAISRNRYDLPRAISRGRVWRLEADHS